MMDSDHHIDVCGRASGWENLEKSENGKDSLDIELILRMILHAPEWGVWFAPLTPLEVSVMRDEPCADRKDLVPDDQETDLEAVLTVGLDADQDLVREVAQIISTDHLTIEDVHCLSNHLYILTFYKGEK